MRPALLLSILMLSACATAPDPPPSASGATLPQQGSTSGDCAIFGWTTDARRRYVFYADEAEAKYIVADDIVRLEPLSPFPSLNYLDPQDRPVSLRLGEGELMVGGMRYPGARIVTVTDEGWERLMPVAIVRSCQLSDVQ